jgi:hypothetical protein
MKSSEVMSLRLDADTRRAIARLARLRRRSQSEIVREAVARLIERAPDEDRPIDAWEPVLGIARGGPPDLSERTGKAFAALLRGRHGRRR